MIGQECGLGLRKTGKRLTFRKNIADEFMVFFQSAFLPGGHRITVKDKGMASVAVLTFKDGRIFKRGSIIGQDHGKKPGILCGSQRSIQEVKDLFDRCPGIRLHEKKEHKRTAAEKKRKKDRGTFATGSLHYIDFYNGTVRTGRSILFKIGISTPHTVAGDFSFRPPFFSGFIRNFSGQIQIYCGETAKIDIVIKGTLRTVDFFFVGQVYMGERLPLF